MSHFSDVMSKTYLSKYQVIGTQIMQHLFDITNKSFFVCINKSILKLIVG